MTLPLPEPAGRVFHDGDEHEHDWVSSSDAYTADQMLAYAAQAVADDPDAMRWRWLVRHAALGFDGSPSWNAVVRLPVFDSDDQTITALVDRARELVGT